LTHRAELIEWCEVSCTTVNITNVTAALTGFVSRAEAQPLT